MEFIKAVKFYQVFGDMFEIKSNPLHTKARYEREIIGAFEF